MLSINLEYCDDGQWLAHIANCNDNDSCAYGETAQEAVANLMANFEDLTGKGVIVGDTLYKYDRASYLDLLTQCLRNHLGVLSLPSDILERCRQIAIDRELAGFPNQEEEENDIYIMTMRIVEAYGEH